MEQSTGIRISVYTSVFTAEMVAIVTGLTKINKSIANSSKMLKALGSISTGFVVPNQTCAYYLQMILYSEIVKIMWILSHIKGNESVD